MGGVTLSLCKDRAKSCDSGLKKVFNMKEVRVKMIKNLAAR